MSQVAQQTIAVKFIGKTLRVTTLNNRIFQGKLMCVDSKSNLILQEAIAEIPKQQNCELNYYLNNYLDSKLHFQPSSQLSEQQKKQALKQYIGSHYYIGSIMISGKDLKLVEMLKTPVSQTQKKQENVKQHQEAKQKK